MFDDDRNIWMLLAEAPKIKIAVEKHESRLAFLSSLGPYGKRALLMTIDLKQRNVKF